MAVSHRFWAAAFVAALTVGGAGEAFASCAGKWPKRWEMPLKNADIGKKLADVVNQKGFFRAGATRNNDNRLGFANVPGGGVGIKMTIPKGENKIVSFDLAPLGQPGAQKACLTMEVYLPSGFTFGTAGTKLGWGLWGGDTDENNSGGIPPQLQEGWSMRNVTNKNGTVSYSYHLNRNGKNSNASKCKPYQCEFGVQLGNRTPLQIGKWNQIAIEVQMNTIGSSNGIFRMWVNGKQTANSSGLQWRKKSSWAIQGLKFTDMWGGDTSDPKNFSPKKQAIYYRDYTIYASSGGSGTGGGSGGGSSDGNDGGFQGGGGDGGGSNAGTPNDGTFGPIYPAINSTIKKPSQLVWQAHPKADKYYIRIVDAQKNTKWQVQLRLPDISCDSSGACDAPYKGSALGNGEHAMTLRAVDDGNELEEIRFTFTIASNGASAPGGSSTGGSDSGGGGTGSGDSGGGNSGGVVTNNTGGEIVMIGTSGADTISGSARNEYLQGRGGADILIGLAGNDRLEGGGSADQLYGGSGIDLMVGGKGLDRFRGSIAELNGDRISDLRDGERVIVSGVKLTSSQVVLQRISNGSYLKINGGSQGRAQIKLDHVFSAKTAVLDGPNNTSIIEFSDIDELGSGNGRTLIGSSRAETLTGTVGDDILRGFAGPDILLGREGSDTLLGGADADQLYGGLGADVLTGGPDRDRFRGSIRQLDGDRITDLEPSEQVMVTAQKLAASAIRAVNVGGSTRLDIDGGSSGRASVTLSGIKNPSLKVSTAGNVTIITIN